MHLFTGNDDKYVKPKPFFRTTFGAFAIISAILLLLFTFLLSVCIKRRCKSHSTKINMLRKPPLLKADSLTSEARLWLPFNHYYSNDFYKTFNTQSYCISSASVDAKRNNVKPCYSPPINRSSYLGRHHSLNCCRFGDLYPIQENFDSSSDSGPNRRYSTPDSFHLLRPMLTKRGMPHLNRQSRVEMTASTPSIIFHNVGILRYSLSYIPAVDMLQVFVDNVTDIAIQSNTIGPEGILLQYIVRIRLLPRMKTGQSFVQPVVTPAVTTYLNPTFEHFFQFSSSLEKLDRARLEVALLVSRHVKEMSTNQRRHSIGSHNLTGRKIKLSLRDFSIVGIVKVTINSELLTSQPEIFSNAAKALTPVKVKI